MTATVADVVVAGGGHNGLVTAAYLARSGRDVVVVEANERAGGGAVTEELLLPGHAIDTCSTGHTLIQTNPLLADDELGLLADQGLAYVEPDPVASVVFPDGSTFTMWLDLDRTVAELERYSREDAVVYQRMLEEWGEVGPLFGRVRNLPVGWGPSLDDLLAEHPAGSTWRRRVLMSAWDVVRQHFHDPHVQAFALLQALATFASVDLPGTGTLPFSILAGRQRRGWTLPLGGSGRLTDALVAVIERAGGTMRYGEPVTRLVLEDGRCTGVETATGDRLMAREAVVSSIHVQHLVDMAPREEWDAGFLHGVETFHPGLGMFVVHLVLSDAPRLVGDPIPTAAVASGYAGWPQDVVDQVRRVRDGRPAEGFPWMMVATPTLADPSRAPHGHHTVKLLVPASPCPPGGASSWDDARDAHATAVVAAGRRVVSNLDDTTVLAQVAHSPVDIERRNAHMVGGAAHGGDRTATFTGAQRPAPGWAQHRTPIAGLYQTGGTTHPGGSITGMPGRNAARVVLHDLGTSLETVVRDTAVTER